MRVKSTVFWKEGNSIRFGVVESICTTQSLELNKVELAIRCEAELGLQYKLENDVSEIYGSYDSELVDAIDTILKDLNKMYETPTDEKAP